MILNDLLLPTGRTAPRTLPGPGVRLGPLAAAGQPRTMPAPSIRSEIHEPFDIHGDLATPVTLNNVIIFNDLPDPGDIITVQVIAVHLIRQIDLIKNVASRAQPNTKNTGERSIHMLVSRQINA